MANLFLTGHRKSGTSMLSRLFDSHPELSLYPTDVSLLYAYFPVFAASETDPSKLRQRIAVVLEKSLKHGLSQSDYDENSDAFILRFIDSMLSKLQDESLHDRRKILQALVSAWRQTSGAASNTRVVLKETSQSVHFLELKNAIPNLKFLHLMRDPRDIYAAIKAGISNYYSALGEGEYESLASVLNRFKVDTKAARTYSAAFPSLFSIIRFEDLVFNPESTMRAVASFGDFSFDECLLTPSDLGTEYKGNSHDGIAMSGISPQNVGRWRERIRDEEAMIIEFWLGDEMERHGYQRQFSDANAVLAFSNFYDWYNTKYFYSDSF